MVFPVVIYRCEKWKIKKAECWRIDVFELLEKTLESSLDWREIKPINPEGHQSWIYVGRIDSEPEAPVLWPPNANNWLIRKDPNAGKDWRQEEKGTIENEMVGWYHLLDGHDFEHLPGVVDEPCSLVCSTWWGYKELDMTELLKWTECVAQWIFKRKIHSCNKNMIDKQSHISIPRNTFLSFLAMLPPIKNSTDVYCLINSVWFMRTVWSSLHAMICWHRL